MKLRALTALALVALVVGRWGPAAGAHTEADVVAVPAGATSTITLKPTHGCGDSPTVSVAVQAPVAGATAGAVPGWTTSATDDGQGHTVVEWTGGSLPADQDGAFPIRFTAPGTVGALLTFPAVQTCENGEELSWISGDPGADYPSPRVLVLAAGATPAHTLDEVPADAPGRDQLSLVVDVDNPTATTVASTSPPADRTTTVPGTSAPSSTVVIGPSTDTEGTPAPADDGTVKGDMPWPLIVAVAIGVLVIVAGAIALRSRDQATAAGRGPNDPTDPDAADDSSAG